jgi:Ca2+-binding RTX toxin-like protein
MTTVSTDEFATNFDYQINDGQVFNLTATGSLTATGFFNLSVNNEALGQTTSLTLLGSIVAGSYVRIDLGARDRVTIGRDAVIAESTSAGGIFTTFNQGVTLTNFGTVLAAGVIANFNFGNARVVNQGDMTGATGGLLMGLNGPGDRVTNHGTITVLGDDGDRLSGHGIVFDAENHSLLNTGTIEVFATGRAAVHIGQPDGEADITNSGRLVSHEGPAISAVGGGAFGGVLIDNAGEIISIRKGLLAISLGDGADVVQNDGRIAGGILTGGGNDVIELAAGSRVTGGVNGGAGDDIYRVSVQDARLVEGANSGTDLVVAFVDWELGENFENLTLGGSARIDGSGNAAANTIRGNRADNVLTGLFGADSLLGGDGRDLLFGGRNNDTIVGDDGEDTILGGRDADSIIGGEDDDRLIGGLGADTLRGSVGADVFVFADVKDSSRFADMSDLLADFERGVDVIDLSQIDANANAPGNQAFSYIGAAAFGNVAGQLRYTSIASSLQVEMDVNGDGRADSVFRVPGFAPVPLTSFLL